MHTYIHTYITVVAIPLSDIASETDEILVAKKHNILANNCWSYIFVIKV